MLRQKATASLTNRTEGRLHRPWSIAKTEIPQTLRRAKFDLGVVSKKESISGCWNWALPENEELANA